jgi:predicted RNase H-like HicB family nuclease
MPYEKPNRDKANKTMGVPKYTVVIQWSDEDQAYVVSLPEWGPTCKTHGATYEEAAGKAQEVLEMLVQNHDAAINGPLPKPHLFRYPGADVIDVPGESRAPARATRR